MIYPRHSLHPLDPESITWYEQIGVVQAGPRVCEYSSDPGVYGRVTSVLQWIKNNIEGDGSISCPVPQLP